MATDGGVANSPDGRSAKDSDATAVDPETWRLVTLKIFALGDSGGTDVLLVKELMPLSALRAYHAEAGGYIPVPLDLGDINEVGLGAYVESIAACPAIEGGPGRVVLSTITHLNDYGFHLTLTSGKGETETLGVTGFHKLYTEDRGWVSAADLTTGEVIRGDHGPLTVAGLARDPGVHRVYNLTVEADHVYYVGDLTALSHNIDDCDARTKEQALRDLVNEATNGGRKPLSPEDAEAIRQWAREHPAYPNFRDGPGDVGSDGHTPNWTTRDGPTPHFNMPSAGRKGHVPVPWGTPPGEG